MKKFFTLFLVLITTTALWAEDFSVDGIYYDYLEGKNVEVTYKGISSSEYSNEYSDAVTIPASVTYEGTTYSVTSIGDAAFRSCSSLTSITIPNSVTSIEGRAFEDCSSLTSITIPESVTRIGDVAFGGCSSLTSVTIPNSVTSIGEYAFSDCSKLTSITIPESVTSIGSRAFYDCSSLPVENNLRYADTYLVEAVDKTLSTYSIKDGTKWIGDAAFRSCSSLTSITIPNSVTSIGSDAFKYCSSLTSVTIPNSVTSIGEWAFYECSGLTSVTIGNSVTSIGDYAFDDTAVYNNESNWESGVLYISNCLIAAQSNISGTCTIKDGTRLIGGRAFGGCSLLTSITIPNSVTSIGSSAFYGCSGLRSITIPNSVTSIGESAFVHCESLPSITIPNSVTSLGNGAFSNCRSLVSLTISNNVTSIEDWTFSYCFSLSSITIPNGVTSIGNFAFFGCSLLTSLTIPSSLTSIGIQAFDGCSGLTSITIPNSVTSIGNYAFGDCSGLTSITSLADIPPITTTDAFSFVDKTIPVHVPCGQVDAYQSATGWSEFTNIQGPQVEYAIQVSTSNSQMGSAIVVYNTSCDAQISATANYGYHFVQWSDGNTDNPRTLELVQDTILTAEFAANKYYISTVSDDPKRGTTSGDTLAAYLDYVTISATAKYGYHFSSWENGNADNPRLVQVTGDKEYMAYFDKNTYTVTTVCDGNYGTVSPSVTGEYLDTITLTATPTLGYHFSRWSDGNTQNPREYVVKKDVTLTAEFAQSFAGQCGDNLYWAYNESDQSIAITGTGDMYNYTSGTQPWILFLEKIKKATTDNTAASLGTSAFEGAIRLAEVHIGAKIDMIEANVFAGCNRLRNIYCYPTYPPIIRESSFARYDALLYIPCDYLDEYEFDNNWKKFENIQCAGAEKEEIESDDVDVDPSSTSVTMTWPTEENANTYTIEIMKGGALFCRLVFNTTGQLLNISFAPSRDGNNRPVQYAEQVANGSGLRFTVTGLNERTHYTYDLRAKDKDENTIQSHSGEFTTKSNVTTDMDNIQSPASTCQKVMRNGQLIILRDGKTYTTMGAEIQ